MEHGCFCESFGGLIWISDMRKSDQIVADNFASHDC